MQAVYLLAPGTPSDYRLYALDRAAKMGLDPKLVDRIFKIESGYDQLAASGSGSTGIGQLVKSTAKHYGLNVPSGKAKTDDATKDERLNPIMNIDASLKYMADLNKKYKGDPELIAVAYNQGEPILDAHLRKNGGKLVPANLQQEIADQLKRQGKLNNDQIAARAAEPINYLNKLATTKVPDIGSLAKGETIEQPTPAPVKPDNSIPYNYKKEQVEPPVAPRSQWDALLNAGRNVVGAGETALHYGTGMLAIPTAGAAALLTGNTPEEREKKFAEYAGQVTYDPRLPEGQNITEETGKVLSGLPAYMGHVGPTRPVPRKTGLPGLAESTAAFEKAAEAERAAKVPRLLPPASTEPTLPGLLEWNPDYPSITSEAKAVAEQARETRRLRQQQADIAAATAAKGEATTGMLEAGKRSAIEERMAQMEKENQGAAGRAQAVAPLAAIPTPQGGISDLTAQPQITQPPVTGYTDEATRLAQRYPVPEAKEEEAGLETLLPKAEEKKGGTDWNDLMIKMGLNLMASKDPNAISGVGQAGLGTLGMMQAEEKAKSEAAYREAMGKHYTMPSANIQELEWARDPKNMALIKQIAQAKADPKTSSQEALAFLKDNGLVLKEVDPVLYGVLRNKVLGNAVPQVLEGAGSRS